MNSIVYSSQSGNTRLLAEVLGNQLDNVIYYGKNVNEALKANTIYVGFWTLMGTCDKKTIENLKAMRDKRIFLFGTAGFGGDQTYFNQIIEKVKENIDSSNEIIGTYMCQGKMPITVREKYESQVDTNPHMKVMIDNFEKALTHPSQDDISKLIECIKK